MADHTVTRDGPEDGRFTATLLCDGEPFASQLFDATDRDDGSDRQADVKAEVHAWAEEHTAAHVKHDHAND